jgi:hypothetical protein
LLAAAVDALLAVDFARLDRDELLGLTRVGAGSAGCVLAARLSEDPAAAESVKSNETVAVSSSGVRARAG